MCRIDFVTQWSENAVSGDPRDPKNWLNGVLPTARATVLFATNTQVNLDGVGFPCHDIVVDKGTTLAVSRVPEGAPISVFNNSTLYVTSPATEAHLLDRLDVRNNSKVVVAPHVKVKSINIDLNSSIECQNSLTLYSVPTIYTKSVLRVYGGLIFNDETFDKTSSQDDIRKAHLLNTVGIGSLIELK